MLRKQIPLSHVIVLMIGLTAGAILGGLTMGAFAIGSSDSTRVLAENPFGPQFAHATATDRYENFAIATGSLDNDIEAVYFLDFLTGDLKAAALSLQTGKFNSFYSYNVLKDLEVDATKNPRYLMVTGRINLRNQGSREQLSSAVVYVAELTSGKVAAYMTPYLKQTINSGKTYQGELVPLDVRQFRTTAIRGG